MWESHTNTWEQTGHHKIYEVPPRNMRGTVWKRKASSLICSHTRSHRFYLALALRALFPSPLPTACLWWEFHTPSLLLFHMDILHRGRREGQKQLPSASTLRHNLQPVMSLVFQRGSAAQAPPGELVPAQGDCQFSSTEREQTHRDTFSCLNK